MRNVLTAEEADVTVDEFWESRHKLACGAMIQEHGQIFGKVSGLVAWEYGPWP